MSVWKEPRNHPAPNGIEKGGNNIWKFSHFLKVPQQVFRAGTRTKFPGSWSSPLALLHHSMDAITRTNINNRDEEYLVVCGLDQIRA